MEKALGVVRSEMAMDFGSKEVGLMLNEGGLSMYCYGNVKSPD